MNHGEAINACLMGFRMTRKGWNCHDMWLRYIDPYQNIYFKVKESESPIEVTMLPWIGLHTKESSFVPWVASQVDILAEDWLVAP